MNNPQDFLTYYVENLVSKVKNFTKNLWYYSEIEKEC